MIGRVWVLANRICWPVPAAWVIVLAVLTAALTAASVATARDWVIVPMALVSLMPRNGVILAGPVALVASALAAQLLLDRRSVATHPSAVRTTTVAPLRLVAVLTIAAGAGYLLSAVAGVSTVAASATGGSIQWAVVAMGVPALMVFVVVGAIIGSLVRSWWGPLVAALAGALLVFAPVLTLSRTESIPAITQWMTFLPIGGIGEPAATGPVLAVAGWWLLLAATGVAAFILIRRRRAHIAGRLDRLRLTVTAAASTVLAAVLLLIAPGTIGAQSQTVECAPAGQTGQVCLLQDEAHLLPELSEQTEATLARVGNPPLPQWALVSYRAYPAYDPPDDVTVIQASVTYASGLRYTQEGIAGWLSGIDACPIELDPNTPQVTQSLGVALWLARPEETAAHAQALNADPNLEATDFINVQLYNAEDDVAADWYAQHQSALMACEYTGAGPT